MTDKARLMVNTNLTLNNTQNRRTTPTFPSNQYRERFNKRHSQMYKMYKTVMFNFN